MKKLFSLIGVAVLAIGFYAVNGSDSILEFLGQEGNNPKAESVEMTNGEKDLLNTEFDKDKYPNYYAKVDNNKTELTDDDKALLDEKGTDEKWASYSNLDNLGRSGEVRSLITYDGVLKHSKAYLKNHGGTYDGKQINDRPPFPYNVHVSGEYQDGEYDANEQTWKGENSNNDQVRFDDGSNQWLYNKSHSFGWGLGGDMETHNVTLGTRYQNVGTDRKGGMAYAETKIKDAVYDNHDLKVYYDVKPLYKDNELVPRGSHVRAYSVNDDGKTININVYVFNAQEGFDINYQDGSFENHN